MGRPRPRPRASLRRRARRPDRDPRVVYGVRCVWWDSITRVGVSGTGLPVCPSCGSVLMEVSTEREWWEGVDAHEVDGNPGYRGLMEWMRGRCFPNMAAAQAAYDVARRVF